MSCYDHESLADKESRVRHIRRVTTLTARVDALQLSSLKVGDLRLILQYITPNKYFGEISEYDLDNLEELLDKLDAEVARSLLR